MHTEQAGGVAMDRLDRMWIRGKTFLGTRHAILGGAMTWVSEPRLVSAISGAGGFGVLACGSMTPPLLEKSIAETAGLTPFPFGVNLITMHPDLNALVDVCLASSRVQHVFLAGGLPSREIIRRVTSGGRQAVCFAPTAGVARRLVRDGAGALVIEGSEAGGHIGPVSTSILAQEILPVIRDVPVFVAGGIGRGEAMAQYLMMGASGCQLGTRFVCATESRAHPRFKAAFIRAHARDAVASVQLDPRFPVIPVRAITNRASEEFLEHQRQILEAWSQEKMTAPEAQLAIEHYWAGALRRAVVDGDTEKGSLMAGQSVGMVTAEEPVQTIMDSLVRQALDHIARVDAA